MQDQFGAVVNWVEHGVAPETITASRPITLPDGTAGTRTRPLCSYPDVAVWTGRGSTDDAANFVCRRGRDHYPHAKRQGQLGPYRPASGPDTDAQAEAIANGLAPQ
jgi:feruloyl esterase